MGSGENLGSTRRSGEKAPHLPPVATHGDGDGASHLATGRTGALDNENWSAKYGIRYKIRYPGKSIARALQWVPITYGPGYCVHDWR